MMENGDNLLLASFLVVYFVVWMQHHLCRVLCRAGTEEVKRRTQEAKKMLTTWKDSYFDVRAKIEASGRDQRWEFDRKKLFDRTDYMASICQNLCDVAQVSCGTSWALHWKRACLLHEQFAVNK